MPVESGFQAPVNEEQKNDHFDIQTAIVKAQQEFVEQGAQPGALYKDAAFRKKEDGTWQIEAFIKAGDALTGLAVLRDPSSRALLKILMHEVLVQRDGVMTVGFADIVKLKWFNDVFGHDRANGFIKALADAINEKSAAAFVEHEGYICLCFRLQGDELILVIFGPEAVSEEMLQPILEPVSHTEPNRSGVQQTEQVSAVVGLRSVSGSEVAPDADLDILFNALLDAADEESEAAKDKRLNQRIKDLIAAMGERLRDATNRREEDGSFRELVIEEIERVIVALTTEIGSIRIGQKGASMVLHYVLQLGRVKEKMLRLNRLLQRQSMDEIAEADRLNNEDFVALGMKSVEEAFEEQWDAEFSKKQEGGPARKNRFRSFLVRHGVLK